MLPEDCHDPEKPCFFCGQPLGDIATKVIPGEKPDEEWWVCKDCTEVPILDKEDF